MLLHGPAGRRRRQPDRDHPLRPLRGPVSPRRRRLASHGSPLPRRPHRRPVAPFPMKFGFAIPAYGDEIDGNAVGDLLAAADELGYESAWFPDHIAVPDYAAAVNLSPPFLEPLAACA